MGCFTWSYAIAFLCVDLLRESLERLSVFKKIERRPMAWPCHLTIGSKLSIRIVAYKSVSYKDPIAVLLLVLDQLYPPDFIV